MSRLLHIKASPRGDRSASNMVAKSFLDAYRIQSPSHDVTEIDLWQFKMPEFNGDIINAKYRLMHGESKASAEKEAWEAIENIIEDFKSFDKYLFSIPMWNFSIPYKLKHYIDIITQPTYTFSFSAETGYQGLVTNKPAMLILARGGSYSSQDSEHLDFQQRYMKTFLQFIGFTDIQTILVEPTASGDESVVNKAIKKAASQGLSF